MKLFIYIYIKLKVFFIDELGPAGNEWSVVGKSF